MPEFSAETVLEMWRELEEQGYTIEFAHELSMKEAAEKVATEIMRRLAEDDD